MNDELADYIHHEIERHLAQRYNKRVGLVTSYDPATHSAKVMLQPAPTNGDPPLETDWIPIARQHIGNGWGVLVGLTPGDGVTTGDQVEVTYHDGDMDAGRITGMHFSDEDQPPQVQAGEILVQHEDGRQIKFDTAGNAIIKHGATSAQTTMNADGTIVHMAAPGKFAYHGNEQLTPGQAPGSNGKVYALVQTVSGPSTWVKAQIN